MFDDGWLSVQEYDTYTGHFASEAMRKRAERGLPNCRPPLGYRLERGPLRSHIVVEPEAAKFVKLAFMMVATGNSLRQTLQELTSLGMRSQGGKEIRPSGFWAILHNPFYLGLVRHQGQLIPGGHEPIMTEQTFELVQRRIALKRRPVQQSQGTSLH